MVMLHSHLARGGGWVSEEGATYLAGGERKVASLNRRTNGCEQATLPCGLTTWLVHNLFL